MTDDVWTAVDAYIEEQLAPEDDVLRMTLLACEKAGLPSGSIAANQGKLLELLARLQRAERILEFGTLGGYSAICLARAMPSRGKLVTLEADQRFADVAVANIARAGLAGTVDVRVGPALATLTALVDEEADPFDMVFIDADKQNNPHYLHWSLKLSRPGSLIVADNVVRAGAILDPDGSDERLGPGGIQGVRRFYELLAADPRLTATAIQTVGAKGHDGFALALVTGQ